MKDRLRRLARRAFAPGVKRIGTAEAIAYLQDVAAPRLGLPPTGSFERVRTGANTAVIRWSTVSGETLYARIWPWKRKNSPTHQHREAAALLRAAGLRTPETLLADDSQSTVTQWGVEVVIERAAPGRPMNHLTGDRTPLLLPLARELARLHACEGPAWHKPWLHRQGFSNPRELWDERLDRFRERITPGTSGLTAAEIAQGLETLQQGLASAAKSSPVLVHGDVSPSHIFVDDSAALTWIDLETVHYGAAAEDLAATSRWLSPRNFRAFLRAYAETASRPPDLASLRTFSLLMHWERLNSRVQQTRRRSNRADDGRKGLGKLDRDRRAAEEAIRELLTRAAAPLDPLADDDSEMD